MAVILSPVYSPLNSIHDADGDSCPDSRDAFPFDANETEDSDTDGHGDNIDTFPLDPAEWNDADLDGVGDNSDVFPDDADEWLDTDEDGVGDNSDMFPLDSTQWADRDGDGYGDNASGANPDALPDDPVEWQDSDSDGVGNTVDFDDTGNGMVRISVDFYLGDGTADFRALGDPYFVIWLDAEDDGMYELKFVSGVFNETETIASPYSITVDIPDDTPAFGFWIEVYDSDPEGDIIVDYYPSPNAASVAQLVYPPYEAVWSYYGSDDGLEEADCMLEYSISAVY